MKLYYVDLHVHLGGTDTGQMVKISASRDFNLQQLAYEARLKKGLDIVGLVDAGLPGVENDIKKWLHTGKATELPRGGLRLSNGLTLILGMEVEAADRGGKAHYLAFFPYLSHLSCFARWVSARAKTFKYSTPVLQVSAAKVAEKAIECGGLFLIAHAFTPFKGFYGQVASSWREVFRGVEISGVELGLSSDTALADRISELAVFSFVSNSDAHSAATIGREYNLFKLTEPSFGEISKALARAEGRQIASNFGLDPRMGKYYRSRCQRCNYLAIEQPPVTVCPQCGSSKVTIGVVDRITMIADRVKPVHPDHRPPYTHQIPLRMIPGIGPRTIDLLLATFGTEMNVLHAVTEADLARVVGQRIAQMIILAREGRLEVQEGGGGRYGKVRVSES